MDKILEEIKLDKKATLRRIINCVGVPYSIIVINSKEMYSVPTSRESEMLNFYSHLD